MGVLVHLRTTVRMWAADASRVGLVSDWKRLKLKHMCFAVCRSSARERAFSGPKSPDAPEPPFLPTGEFAHDSLVDWIDEILVTACGVCVFTVIALRVS